MEPTIASWASGSCIFFQYGQSAGAVVDRADLGPGGITDVRAAAAAIGRPVEEIRQILAAQIAIEPEAHATQFKTRLRVVIDRVLSVLAIIGNAPELHVEPGTQHEVPVGAADEEPPVLVTGRHLPPTGQKLAALLGVAQNAVGRGRQVDIVLVLVLLGLQLRELGAELGHIHDLCLELLYLLLKLLHGGIRCSGYRRAPHEEGCDCGDSAMFGTRHSYLLLFVSAAPLALFNPGDRPTARNEIPGGGWRCVGIIGLSVKNVIIKHSVCVIARNGLGKTRPRHRRRPVQCLHGGPGRDSVHAPFAAEMRGRQSGCVNTGHGRRYPKSCGTGNHARGSDCPSCQYPKRL
ncbi:MAG: hypothetical protein ABSH20_26200 [Tepidisphaeraceae bacterium]